MPKQARDQAEEQTRPGGERVRVNGVVLVGRPATIVPATVAKSEQFTRESFEGALDKVSRPVKGKYADMLPSSEEVIEDKRREVELEERQP